MAWTTHEDGTHSCPRHSTAWGRVGDCIGCRTDPGPAPSDAIDTPLSKPPKGCLSTVAVEREFVKDARALEALIHVMTPTAATLKAARAPRKLRRKKGGIEVVEVDELELELDDGGGDYHLVNAIAKLYDTRVKCLRAAAVCAGRREDEEIVRRREKRMRDMRKAAVH